MAISVHVEDVARFAWHAAQHPAALGEDYNVVDDSVISHADFMRYVALLTGRRMWEVPVVPLSALKPLALGAARAWLRISRRWNVPRVKVFEPGSAVYLGGSYWVQNDKSKSIGFEYRYPDVRVGIRETILWLRGAGYLTGRAP